MTALHFSALLTAALVAWAVELSFRGWRWLIEQSAGLHDVEGDDGGWPNPLLLCRC